MKQILLSSVIITTLGALVVGSTAALFNDQKVIAGNTVATSSLELTLNHSAGKPFNVANAYPGYWTDWELMDIYNTGDLPFEAYMDFQKTSGSTTLYDNLSIILKTSGYDSDCSNGDAGENIIYDGLIKDYDNTTVVSDISFWHLANEDDGSGPNDNIRTGWSERVCQKIGLESSVGSEIMGTSVIFSEIVNAMQDND